MTSSAAQAPRILYADANVSEPTSEWATKEDIDWVFVTPENEDEDAMDSQAKALLLKMASQVNYLHKNVPLLEGIVIRLKADVTSHGRRIAHLEDVVLNGAAPHLPPQVYEDDTETSEPILAARPSEFIEGFDPELTPAGGIRLPIGAWETIQKQFATQETEKKLAQARDAERRKIYAQLEKKSKRVRERIIFWATLAGLGGGGIGWLVHTIFHVG